MVGVTEIILPEYKVLVGEQCSSLVVLRRLDKALMFNITYV